MTTRGKVLLAAGGIGAGVIARGLLRGNREPRLRGEVAFVTGGSKGLGLALAREFAREGCKLALCARDETELRRAASELERNGAQVLTLVCDVSSREQVERSIDAAVRHFERIDILVNNAGIIMVGPVESMTVEDFEQSMNVMFWGTVYATLAVLPAFTARKSGRIVNITSIGGKVSVPHLLPYSCAKYAAAGFSEGLRSELGPQGISVTTIAPGLMRTGSYVNAFFKGDRAAESQWFGLSSSMPLISMGAARAAKQIVDAAIRNDSEKVLSTPASLLARLHGLFPGATSDLLGFVGSLVLPSGKEKNEPREGAAISALRTPAMKKLLALGRLAGEAFNQRYA